MNRILIFIILLFPLTISAQVILGDPRAIVYSMDVQPQNRLLVAALGKDKVELWNYDNQTLLKSWQLDSRANAVAIANNIIVVAKSNGVIDIYDATDLERVTNQKLTDNVPLLDVKVASDSVFILRDATGNFYKSDFTSGYLVFSKLFEIHDPVVQFDFIAKRNAILTFHESGKVLLTSMNGVLLQEKQILKSIVVAVEADQDEAMIYVSFKNGKILRYSTGSTNFMHEIEILRNPPWAVSIDCEKKLVAFGTTTGLIKIQTNNGTYRKRLDVIINVTRILPEKLPAIFLAIGTHGGGIQILSAFDMKFN